MAHKTSLRQLLRTRRSSFSEGGQGALLSRRVQERLLASAFWQNCRRVAAYVSVKGEVGTERILEEALRSGRELFLPRCRVPGEKDWQGGMDFIFCPGLDQLKKSAFGIPEPSLLPESRLLAPAELREAETLIVVPALAFDRKGFRLGYGGGYYDRLLAVSSCPAVGLTFHELLQEELPRNEWDRPVQAVCTEEALLCV